MAGEGGAKLVGGVGMSLSAGGMALRSLPFRISDSRFMRGGGGAAKPGAGGFEGAGGGPGGGAEDTDTGGA